MLEGAGKKCVAGHACVETHEKQNALKSSDGELKPDLVSRRATERNITKVQSRSSGVHTAVTNILNGA